MVAGGTGITPMLQVSRYTAAATDAYIWQQLSHSSLVPHFPARIVSVSAGWDNQKCVQVSCSTQWTPVISARSLSIMCVGEAQSHNSAKLVMVLHAVNSCV